MSETLPSANYLDLPKSYGQVPMDDLIVIAYDHINRFEAATTPYAKKIPAAIAGSALVEAMIIPQDPTHEHDDYRIEGILLAEQYLREVVRCEEAILETGIKMDNESDFLRAQLQLAFVTVYSDIICGEITPDTCREITEELQRIERRTSTLLSYRHTTQNTRTSLSGLRSELRVFIDAWKAYIKGQQEFVAIPASYRGDHGSHREGETHDIVFLIQNPDTTFDFSHQREIKTEPRDPDDRLAQLARYNGGVTYVTGGKNGGKISSN